MMSRKTSFQYAIVSTIFSMIATPSFAQSCDIKTYYDTNIGHLSDIQKLVRLDTMSREQWEKTKKEYGGSISIGGDKVGGSYENMKATVNRTIRRSNIENYGRFQKSWAESTLSKNGLKAYIACLSSQEGFHIVASSLDATTIKLAFVWKPGGFATKARIVEHKNIQKSSIEMLNREFGNKPLGREYFDLALPLDRENANKPSRITVRVNNKSRVVHLPAVVKVVVPEAPKPKCAARRVGAKAMSYFSHYPDDTPGTSTKRGVSVGGSGAKPIASERPYIEIKSDCTAILKYSAGARAGNERFPSGRAPKLSITILDDSDAPLLTKDLWEVTISRCGGSETVVRRMPFVTPQMAEKMQSIKLSLTRDEGTFCNR